MTVRESLGLFNKAGIPCTNFPTDNKYGIPLLIPEKQADFFDLPLNIWGEIGRKKEIVGTVGFYTDDYRWSAIVKNPNRVVEHKGIVGAFEINPTMSLSTPLALVLERVYTKRWVSRYWQEHGLNIFVDLWIPMEFMEYNLLGVPRGFNAFCTRAKNDELDQLQERYIIAQNLSERRFPLFVVYGGGIEVKEFCESRGIIFHPESSDMKRGRFNDSYSNLLQTTKIRVNEKVSQGVIVR